MEPATRTYDQWIGRDAYDRNGQKIGEITDIFYDDETHRPEWLAVKTGLFGMKSTFVPIHGSSNFQGDDIQVAFDKDMIKDAPNIGADEHMDPDQERQLWSHYGYDYSQRRDTSYGPGYSTANRADKDFSYRRFDQATSEWRDVGEEESVTIRNQEAQVVERPETIRLRRYQKTEMVPVTKEEVRVERTSDQDVRTTSTTGVEDTRSTTRRK